MGNRGQLQEPGFELSGKFDPNFDQEKQNLVRVSGVFELSEFELTE